MPSRSPRPCRENRAHLTKAADGLCDECRRKVNARYAQRRRGTDKDDSFYHSAEWRRLRDEHLAIEPLCQRHLSKGKIVKGDLAHHLVPRERGGTDSHENLETLCTECHNAVEPRGAVARQGR